MNGNDNGDLLEEARVKHDREMTSGCCRGVPSTRLTDAETARG